MAQVPVKITEKTANHFQKGDAFSHSIFDLVIF